jgi:Zn-dependent peptidase ImmA (M78 family)
VSRTTERDSLIEVRANAFAATFLAPAALDEAVADGTFRIASGSPSIA